MSKSWSQYEKEKDELKLIARFIRDEDIRLSQNFKSSEIIEGTSRSASGKPVPEEFKSIGEAHQRLRDLTHELVHIHGLDFHFVRKEWAVILNPVREERDNCDKLICC